MRFTSLFTITGITGLGLAVPDAVELTGPVQPPVPVRTAAKSRVKTTRSAYR
ncbi:unnamed protein product [Penicillium roqueforti FM164]|uniref:Uncharacterized protein n=1 Tax=Penicillium roqueforti (strain FM164) TaxID=1365484 RepID=W6QM96_PENRF|nr:unnamed protein product [Penicillium roqueforti FM164]